MHRYIDRTRLCAEVISWRFALFFPAARAAAARWRRQASAAELLHRSRQAANEAIALLAQADVLRAATTARRNRAWEARELFDLVDAYLACGHRSQVRERVQAEFEAHEPDLKVSAIY